MASTYIDCFQYQQQPSGLLLSTYVGNQFRFTSAQAIGTQFTVPASAITVPMDAYAYLYIFDGLTSEIVQVASEVTANATTVPLVNSTLYAHSTGVAVCSDGTGGSLGQQIFSASQWIEDICHQSLWESAYVGEVLTLPTMRAAIDNQRNLHFRPRHFPITTLTSISMQSNQNYTFPLDASQAIIDADQQTVDIPCINTTGASNSQIADYGYPYGYPFVDRFNRGRNAWITLSYTAGYPTGQLPFTVQRAAMLLTGEMFAQLSNPVGADQITQGKRAATFAIRGDTSGESLLVKQARNVLSPFIAESF